MATIALVVSTLVAVIPDKIRSLIEAILPAPETCQDHPKLKRLDLKDLVKRSEGGVQGSSKLVEGSSAGDPNYDHEAELAIDYRPDTAWAPERPAAGLPTGSRGEWIEINFSQPVDLHLVCVLNGYTRTGANKEIYLKNAKLRDVTLTTGANSTTTTLENLSVDSRFTYQEVNANDGLTKLVRLTIDDYYPAEIDSESSEDTCLSEIEVWVPK